MHEFKGWNKINQWIQEENIKLRKFLEVEKEDRWKFQLVLEQDINEKVGECSTIGRETNSSMLKLTCEHAK